MNFSRLALIMVLSVAGGPTAYSADWGEIPSKPAYAVDQARWMEMMKKLVKDGERGTYGDSHGVISLSRINPPDTAKTRQADYFSLLGVISNGQFHPMMTSFVSEKWELTTKADTGENIWKIDQWLYSMDLAGAPQSASHRVMIQTLERRVLDITDTPDSGVNSAKAHKKWTELMALWQ